MVLLIFFILTTSYAALQKMLEASDLTSDDKTKVAVVKQKVVQDKMIVVTIKQDGGESVIAVEGDKVPKERLEGLLTALVKRSNKTEMLLDYDPQVPHGVVIAVLDAAKGAGILKVHTVVPPEELR
jgi:biopolymer transport protein ExbD